MSFWTGEFHVGFEGSFGSRHLTARTLTSRHINNLVCLEGIVTKVSLVRPKVMTSVHYCPATSKTMERNYSDMTSIDAYPSTAAYPTQVLPVDHTAYWYYPQCRL